MPSEPPESEVEPDLVAEPGPGPTRAGARHEFDLDDEAWAPVDAQIYAGRPLLAIQAVRDQTSCSIREAIDLVSERFDVLSRDHEDQFTVPIETWGANVYT